MKTLADFKRRLKVGVKLETTHARLGSFGIREIGLVNTVNFAMKTIKKTDSTQKEKAFEHVLSYCEYPKASDFEVVDENTANIYWGEGAKRELILTYKFV